jgi:hypothetical protein
MFTHAQLTVPFFSDFTNVIGDQEPDWEERGWFVPRSARGMPKPWVELPMPHKEGQSVTLDSLLVHAGGAQPPGLAVPAVVAVIAVTGQRLPTTHDPGAAAIGADYNVSGPCDRPLWAPRYALPSGDVPPPRCSACTAALDATLPTFKCAACNVSVVCNVCHNVGVDKVCATCVASPGVSPKTCLHLYHVLVSPATSCPCGRLRLCSLPLGCYYRRTSVWNLSV